MIYLLLQIELNIDKNNPFDTLSLL